MHGYLDVCLGGLKNQMANGLFLSLRSCSLLLSFFPLFAFTNAFFSVRAKYAVSSIKKKVNDKNPHVALYALEVIRPCTPVGPGRGGSDGRTANSGGTRDRGLGWAGAVLPLFHLRLTRVCPEVDSSVCPW